jgi:hypothetical protein
VRGCSNYLVVVQLPFQELTKRPSVVCKRYTDVPPPFMPFYLPVPPMIVQVFPCGPLW